MKKFGFTLAEILITLGIIGVVAALTAPALVQNAGSAKIGPTLAKISSTFEVANEKLLLDASVPRLSAAETLQGDNANYCGYHDAISKYVKGATYNLSECNDSGLVSYTVTSYNGKEPDSSVKGVPLYLPNGVTCLISTRKYDPKGYYSYAEHGNNLGLYRILAVDINGKTDPNNLGKDVFLFIIDESGTLIPVGSRLHATLMPRVGGWDVSSMYQCNDEKVIDGQGCAGSIFDNNLKVIYQ